MPAPCLSGQEGIKYQKFETETLPNSLEIPDSWGYGGEMKYRAKIIDTVTGRECMSEEFDGDYNDAVYGEPHDHYMWTDGNYACDCNRGGFHHRALGIEEQDYPCSGERFYVPYLEYEDGTRLECDDAPESAPSA